MTDFENVVAAMNMEQAHESAHSAGEDIGGMGQMALWAGFFCMAASTFMFQTMAKDDTKRFNYVAMAVTGIATMAYLAMASGAGVETVDGRAVFWMRYVDWFFTTPFFLLDLALLSGADRWDTFYVMLMNAICIGCGAIGALYQGCRYSMFFLGLITFALFNQKLFGAMMDNSSKMGSDVSGKYKAVTGVTMAIWCAYPVMYYLCEVTRTLSITQEILVYVVLDVTAKCACGFLLIGNHDILKQVNSNTLLGNQ
jgi:bacteriorhodopsin